MSVLGQPQNTPIVQKPTPIVLDELLVETSDSNKALYDRFLEVGHYHPDRIKYPSYRLLKQAPNSYGLMQYWWANDFTSQDSYNASKEYDGESNSYPTFIRSYRVLRSDYLVTGPATKGVAFTGIVAISVTNGGTGYTHDFAITFTGGAGAGLAGTAITDGRGVIIRIEITNVGAGFTSAPAITFTNGDGAGAAATAVIQPVTCLLIEEKHSKLSEDDPHSSLYDKVTRTWMTLPGPSLVATKYDAESDVAYTEAKRHNLLASITEGGSIAASSEVTIESEPITDIMGWEITKTFPAATANDLASAITIGEEMAPYQFCGTLNIAKWITSSGLIGYTKPFVRKVPHLTKAFWVISATKPLLSNYVVPPAPGSLFNNTLSGDPIGEVIYDAQNIVYSTITVHYPGSTPNLTTYLAGWVNVSKPVLGSVKEASSRFRWRVEVTYVTMLVPALPNYS